MIYQPFGRAVLIDPAKGSDIDMTKPAPMCEVIKTSTWAPWLPEVLVGIESPNEEIAANYIRAVAIEFCHKAPVLMRTTHLALPYFSRAVTIELKHWPEEHIECVLYVSFGGKRLNFTYDSRSKNLTIFNDMMYSWCTGTTAEVVMAASPTEECTYHDAYLFEHYRKEIANQARAEYARAVHFRDRDLMRFIQPPEQFIKDYMAVRNEVFNNRNAQDMSAGRFNSI